MSVALKLEQLGIPSERIVLFPSHDPDPARFVSEVARENWRSISSVTSSRFNRTGSCLAKARDHFRGLVARIGVFR